MQKIKVKALPAQRKFIESKDRYVLYSGGVGSGKTYALLALLLKYILNYRGIDILVVSGTWPQLRDTFYRGFQSLFPNSLIANHNRTSHTVQTVYNSTIFFRSFDDPQKIGSYTVGLVAAEELTTLREDDFKMLRTRLRQPDQPCHFRAVCNPSALGSWVYKSFIEKPIPKSKVIYGSSFDNSFLPSEYLERFEKFGGQ